MRFDPDYAVHAAIGLAFMLLIVLPMRLTGSPGWLLWLVGLGVLVFEFGFGWIREEIQHSWQKLTPHQIREAIAWPLGGIVALLVLVLV